MTDEQKKLVEDHIRLVTWAAKRMPSKIDFNERFSIANYAMFLAAMKFEPERGKFSTYYEMVARHQAVAYLRSMDRRREVLILDTPVDTGKSDSFCYVDLLASDRSAEESYLVHAALEELQRMKPQRLQTAIHLRINDVNQTEAARIMGMSQPHYCRTLKKAQGEMRRRFEGVMV